MGICESTKKERGHKVINGHKLLEIHSKVKSRGTREGYIESVYKSICEILFVDITLSSLCNGHQYDVNYSFLHGILDEDIKMDIPPRYESKFRS